MINSKCLIYLQKFLRKIKKLIEDGFFHIFWGTFLNKGIAMISSIVVARIIDKTEYAYLSYSETLYGYLILFSGIGMSTALLKLCANRSVEQKDVAYLSYALKYSSIFEIIATSIFLIIILSLTLPFSAAKRFILVTAIYPLVYSIYDILLCYLRAKQKNKLFANLNVLYSILTCILSILFVLWINALGIIIARYVVLLFMGVLVLSYVRSSTKGIEVVPLSKNEKKNFVLISLTLVIANAISGMMPFNESLLVSNLIEDEVTTANFRVAGLFPQLLLLVSQAVTLYFFPIVSAMDNGNANYSAIKRVVIKIGVLNFVLVLGALIIGLLLTPWLIKFFYSVKYMDAIPIAYLLWIMRGLNAAIRVVPLNMLIAVKKYKFNMMMSIFGTIIQICLDWYFISIYGIIGVAYGTIGVYLITGIIYWIYLIKSLKTNNLIVNV